MRVWHRSQTRIRKMRSVNAYPETLGTPSSSAIELPPDVVEIIIAYLIYDMRSLLACSMACRSWYMAAVPHLHHTIDTQTYPYDWYPKWGKKWPKPLVRMHKLGLLPFVKKLHIHESPYSDVNGLFPGIFYCSLLHQYSKMTNLQELAIDHLSIGKFIPKLQRSFGHFSPTLRSLALREPEGSCRQIMYFVGFFQHLEDLKLILRTGTSTSHPQEKLNDYLTPAPRFTPPLRGRLTMRFSREVELLKLMINLFGGLRFNSMDLYCVDGVRLLLDACAETLETLRLFQKGEQLPPRGLQFQLTTTKISVGPLIYPGIGPFGSSRSRHRPSFMRNQDISHIRFQRSHPPCFLKSSSSIGTTTSRVYPLRRAEPHHTTGTSQRSAR